MVMGYAFKRADIEAPENTVQSISPQICSSKWLRSSKLELTFAADLPGKFEPENVTIYLFDTHPARIDFPLNPARVSVLARTPPDFKNSIAFSS